jgi:hypothetical protein
MSQVTISIPDEYDELVYKALRGQVSSEMTIEMTPKQVVKTVLIAYIREAVRRMRGSELAKQADAIAKDEAELISFS